MAAPFNVARDCPVFVQQTVGLHLHSIQFPRAGDRTATGQHGPEMVASNYHLNSLSTESAVILWNLVPTGFKTNPTTPQAKAATQLALNAGVEVPDECADRLGNNLPGAAPVQMYVAPGSYFFEDEEDAAKFIVFVYNNMDEDHRTKWKKMTGQERHEWHMAYVNCGRVWHRVLPRNTRGLRGTDLDDIQTQQELRRAALVSPSVSRRRPQQHNINNQEWLNGSRRGLFRDED